MPTARLTDNIWTRVKALFGIGFIHPTSDPQGPIAEYMRGALPEYARTRLTDPYSQHSVLSTAFSRISEDGSSVEYQAFDVDANGIVAEEPRDDGHPLLRKMERPNQLMRGDQLRMATILSELCTGEGHWWYPDLRLGQPGLDGIANGDLPGGDLQFIPTKNVEYDLRDGMLRIYLTINGVRQFELDQEKLTQFKRWNPNDPLRGLSKIEAILRELLGDHAAAVWNERFFSEQGGVPPIVFLPPREGIVGTQESREDFVKRWTSAARAKRSVAGLAPPGWALQVVGVTQKDMDFSELRLRNREEILAASGVPPLIAGYLDTTIKYNAREQRETYWKGTIFHLLTRHCATINHDLLPKLGITDIQIHPNWESVRPLIEDLESKTTMAKTWFDMGLSKRVINERLEMGWDADSIPDYDIGYLPFSVAPAESVAAGPAEPEPEPGEDDEPGGNGEASLRGKNLGNERVRVIIWRNLIAQTRDLEAAFNRLMRSHFHNLEREALAALDGLKGWQALHDKDSDLEFLFDMASANETLRKRTEPLFRQIIRRGADSLLVQVGLGGEAFLVDAPGVVALITEMAVRVRRVNETLGRQIQRAVASGVEAAENIDQISARIRATFTAARARSKTISRTEVGRGFNAARQESMTQAGVTKHQWLSTKDAKVRDTHAAEDGSIVVIGEPFPNTGLLYPQGEGPAAEVINCRCVALPVLERTT